jgi:hypothetical protein
MAEFPCVPRTKLYVLALVKTNTGRDEELVQDMVGGWMSKHTFRPKLRRSWPVLVSVGTADFCAKVSHEELTGVATILEESSSSNEVKKLSQVLEEAPEQDGSMRSEGSVDSQAETQLCWVQYERAIRGLPWEQ